MSALVSLSLFFHFFALHCFVSNTALVVVETLSDERPIALPWRPEPRRVQSF